MKNTFKTLVAVAVLAIAGSASAQVSATASATASARVIAPIQIFTDNNLNFGGFTAGNTAGSVTVAAATTGAGTRTKTGGVTLYTGTQTASFHCAEFSVYGEEGFTYTCDYGNSSHQFTVASGANTMTATLDSYLSNGTLNTVHNSESPDLDDIFFGATLAVPANQANGTYAGEFSVTVTYN